MILLFTQVRTLSITGNRRFCIDEIYEGDVSKGQPLFLELNLYCDLFYLG